MSKVVDCSKWPKIVDDSKFIPMSELVKRNAANMGNKVFTAAEASAYFDYPQGYVEGKTKKIDIGDSRSTDLNNMAVRSTRIHEKTMEVEEELKKAKAKAEAEAAVKAKYEKKQQ